MTFAQWFSDYPEWASPVEAWDAGQAAERERIAASLERRAGELRSFAVPANGALLSQRVYGAANELERMAALIREGRE